jgi:aminoglycoside 3-N-acetyltransferase
MSEIEVIVRTSLPRTRSSLATDLCQLGLTPGMIVLVNASLSSLGWVCGGSVTVIQALMDVLTNTGTLVMPTQSMDYSDPVEWEDPPVPSEWWSIIRETMPAFDARVTPTLGVGRIAETFRTWPDVVRSSHPTVSFAAWGQHADVIVEGHSLDNSLGEISPLARLYDLNARVLLLGVGYDQNTCFHLSEYRTVGTRAVSKGSPILEAGRRKWKQYSDIEFDTDCFAEIGAAFEQANHVKASQVGDAQTKLFPLKYAVDFAVSWLNSRHERR